eukprot:TRINITY_DN22_c0_g1_i6.p1 TRINITY_DN22_c0_g1~~TRINITY_DN22_c0_g1_i6.p1  ORF type:complete len:218 (+),score=67.17 TRINITY_DN22_c0_g1_i6:49-702(+)
MPRAPRRRALLVGINYYKQQGELRGCINDVKNLKNFLIQNGFSSSPSDMTVLTDDGLNTALPTRANILAACMWLVHDNQPGDLLFFHYSGHGSQAADTTGDEADGTDETLVPVDYRTAGMIVDDDLHSTLVKPLNGGVRFYSIFDCCHSGTALDLPFVYAPSGKFEGAAGAPRGVAEKKEGFEGIQVEEAEQEETSDQQLARRYRHDLWLSRRPDIC